MSDIAFNENKIIFRGDQIAFLESSNRFCCCNCPGCADLETLIELQLDIVGFTDNSCNECVSDINGTHIVTAVDQPGSGGGQGTICYWNKPIPGVCNFSGITMELDNLGRFLVSLGIDGTGILYFSFLETIDLDDCLNLDVTLPYFTGSTTKCGNHTGVTVRIRVA